MSVAVIILPRAARQVSVTVLWWRANRPHAVTLLEDELVLTVARIGEMPNVGLRVRGRAGVRRVLLRRTGYALFYRAFPRAGRVELLALWHAKRGPGPDMRTCTAWSTSSLGRASSSEPRTAFKP